LVDGPLGTVGPYFSDSGGDWIIGIVTLPLTLE